jgi:TRAP-type C4-dicarboxylate transport system substrate-binding protein
LFGAAANAQPQYPAGYYGQAQGWHGVLSPDDQKQFDKYYSKWVDASRKNDQDDIANNAQHMEEIMARYNIPANTPFDQVASAPGAAGYAANPNGAYSGAYPAYGWQGRLSPEDQHSFDKDYSKWLDAQRKNDQDDLADNARKMEQIMARYNIPPNVPFAAIATNGYAAGPNAAYGSQYYGQAQRLSAKDQKEFDEHYQKWMEARRKKNINDIDKNARKMQEIMARYNIPANVPFQQIASQPAY